MEEVYAIFAETLVELGEGARLPRLEAHIAHRATVPGVESMLREAGCCPRRTVTRDLTMRYLDGSALLRHSLIRQGFLPAWRDVVGGLDEAVVFGALERNLNQSAVRRRGLELRIPLAYIEAYKA